MSATIMVSNGDLAVTVGGAFVVISGIHKCAQDIAEALLNNWDPEGANTYNGSELYLIQENPSMLSSLTAEERIRSAVDDAVDRLRDSQSDDEYADDDEIIEEIRELWASKLGDFTYGFSLRAITASFAEVPMGFKVRIDQQLPAGVDELDLQSFVTPTQVSEPYA